MENKTMKMYITAPSRYGDDYLITNADLEFYNRIADKEKITLLEFLEFLEEKEADIYSFYLNPQENGGIIKLDISPTMDWIMQSVKPYLEYEIEEAVYQDLDIKVKLRKKAGNEIRL